MVLNPVERRNFLRPRDLLDVFKTVREGYQLSAVLVWMQAVRSEAGGIVNTFNQVPALCFLSPAQDMIPNRPSH